MAGGTRPASVGPSTEEANAPATPAAPRKEVRAHRPVKARPRVQTQSAGTDASPHDQYKNLTLTPISINGRVHQVTSARAVPAAKYSASLGPILFSQNGFNVVAGTDDSTDLVYREGDRPSS